MRTQELTAQFRELYFSRSSEDERIALLADTCKVLREIDLGFQAREFRLQLAAEADRYELLWEALVTALRALDTYDSDAVDRVLSVVDHV